MSPRLNRDGAAYRALLQLGDDGEPITLPVAQTDDLMVERLRRAFAAELDRQVQRFGVLRYRGDLTADLLPGQILGADERGRPYEVLDAEVGAVVGQGHTIDDACTYDAVTAGPVVRTLLARGHFELQTAVHLQYATPDSLARAFAELGGAR